MEVKELRIGNIVGKTYFQLASEKHIVSSIKSVYYAEVAGVYENAAALRGERGLRHVAIENIEPIPITEEWLLKFGFKEYHSTGVVRRFESTVLGDVVFHLSATNYLVIKHLFVRCEYVHQLQNIFFALKNEELTIKTETK